MKFSFLTLREWNHRERLVFARGGKVFAAFLDGNVPNKTELVDLNENTFAPLEAPEWAREW